MSNSFAKSGRRRRKEPIPSPSPTPAPQPNLPRYAFRGIYDLEHYGITAVGAPEAQLLCSHINATPTVAALDQVTAVAMKAFIWLGSWNNSTLAWTKDDAWLTSSIDAVKAHPANDHWYIVADEPSYSATFKTAAEARIALIKAHDPAAKVVLTDYHSSPNWMPSWAGIAGLDEVWIDAYPVRGTLANIGSPGTFDTVTTPPLATIVANAEAAGLAYKGVIGLHNDQYVDASHGSPAGTDTTGYTGINARKPTPAQVTSQMNFWRTTNATGIVYFAWKYPKGAVGAVPGPPDSWIGHPMNDPTLQAQIRIENARP